MPKPADRARPPNINQAYSRPAPCCGPFFGFSPEPGKGFPFRIRRGVFKVENRFIRLAHKLNIIIQRIDNPPNQITGARHIKVKVVPALFLQRIAFLHKPPDRGHFMLSGAGKFCHLTVNWIVAVFHEALAP